VENVAPWLVERILASHKSGARLSYSSGLKLLGRFLSSPFVKRNLLD
jgi:hypothetical protein